MAKADALNQLRDIHMPEPVSWWPMAIGWYLLIAFILIITGLVSYKLYRRYMNHRAKHQALRLLADYRRDYEKEKNSQLISARLSELLRRVALAYYPRARVAALTGDEWIDFLNSSAKQVDFNPVRNMLLEMPFQAKQNSSLKPLFTRTEKWIKQQGVPCSN